MFLQIISSPYSFLEYFGVYCIKRTNEVISVQLDVTKFSDEVKYQPIGKLRPEIVDFILSKKPEFAGRISSDTDILFWKARVKHTERHRDDFNSSDDFDEYLKNIPSIIQNPDYISIHPTDESVSFIKKYDQNVSVAIKISTQGQMVYRTMYPLRDSQLNNYIENDRCWEIST